MRPIYNNIICREELIFQNPQFHFVPLTGCFAASLITLKTRLVGIFALGNKYQLRTELIIMNSKLAQFGLEKFFLPNFLNCCFKLCVESPVFHMDLPCCQLQLGSSEKHSFPKK